MIRSAKLTNSLFTAALTAASCSAVFGVAQSACAQTKPPPAAALPESHIDFEPAGDDRRVLRFDTTLRGPEDISNTETQNRRSTAAAAADDGLLSPYVLSARIVSGRSWMKAVAGYDAAVDQFRAHTTAESAVTSWFALSVDYERGPSFGMDNRFGVRGRLQFLDQKRHGIDAGCAVFYQPNDFRREGNVGGGLLLMRRLGRLGLLGSALIGTDPEGDDQEVDGRIAVLLRVLDGLQLGVDNRFRTVVTDDVKRNGTTTTDWEFTALPNASLSVGPIAIIAEAGLSTIQRTTSAGLPEQHRHMRAGLLAMAGAAAAF